MTRIPLLLIFSLLLLPLSFLSASGDKESPGELLLYSNLSSGSPRSSLSRAVSLFEKEYPHIEVTVRSFDHSSYESRIVSFLTADSPDLLIWSNGFAMTEAARMGLLLGLDDIWEEEGLYELMASSREGLSVGGIPYGIPFAFYHWGVYYRKDLFQEAGLEVPETWEDLELLCSRLMQRGITPFTLGTKFPWTAALWFDYLNLRINGYEFHRDLLAGRISWLDHRLDSVFSRWRDFIGRGYFHSAHEELSWFDALDLLTGGEAAMCLMGSFIEVPLEEEGVMDSMGFFPFPALSPEAGVSELAPTGTLHIPSAAEHPEEARLFLKFMAGPEAQELMKGTSLSPRNDLKPPKDPFLAAGYCLLSDAHDLSPFFDRACDPGISNAASEAMKAFMLQPEKENEIRAELEAIRAGFPP